MEFKHISVLIEESIVGLNIKPDGIYVDCTTGGGGHSLEIAKQLITGRLICFDKDTDALTFAKTRLSEHLNKITFVNNNFANIDEELDDLGIEKVDGILTGKFTIPKEMFNGDKNLTCRATYQEVVYEKVLFVDLEDTPYELQINKSILQRDKDTGKLIDDSILVKVKYWMDGIWKDTDEGKVVLTCESLGNDMLSGNEPNDKHLRTIFFDVDNRLLYTDDSDVRISYYLTDSKGNIIGEDGIIDYNTTGVGNEIKGIFEKVTARPDMYELHYNEDPFHIESKYVAKKMPEGTKMVPRVFKTNVGDIFTTNMVNFTKEELEKGILGLELSPNADGVLSSATNGGDGTVKWQVVKVYTMPDRQPGVKLMRIA